MKFNVLMIALIVCLFIPTQIQALQNQTTKIAVNEPVETQQQNQYQPVLFLKTDNNQVVEGNRLDINVMINSLGNEITAIKADVVIEGPIRPRGLTYNMHPRHASSISRSSDFQLVSYQPKITSDNQVVATIEFIVQNDVFNEGSAEVPLYQIGLVAQKPGLIKSYLKNLQIRTSLNTESSQNYTPENRALGIQVVSVEPKNEQITEEITEATPSTTQTQDQEFEQLQKEIDEVNRRLDKTEEEVSTLKNLVDKILSFFRNLFN